jgi:excisionase family DNA binding protein
MLFKIVLCCLLMSDLEKATLFSIAEAKTLGLAEVGPDELLRGCLRAISRFGVVTLGPVLLDLERAGVLWMDEPVRSARKVAYSEAVIALFDLGAKIAKADGGTAMKVEHLLVAYADSNSGLMGELKSEHKLTSAGWRAAVAAFAASRVEDVERGSGDRVSAARDYLTPEEAAEAIGIHVQTLRGYVRSGKLPALRLAGERAIRIRRMDLETVLEPMVPQSMPGPDKD